MLVTIPKFNNEKLLEQAFIHRSFINENQKTGLEHNERLEFLGDAVLELIVTEYLYKKYKEAAEGELTAYRAGLVNMYSLAKVSSMLGLNDRMRLSKGEQRDDNSKARLSILADAYEALLGAIYLDRGLEVAKEFVYDTLMPELVDIVKYRLYKDAKSNLQERAQEDMSVTPIYKILKESGPDHSKEFVAGVYLDDVLVAEGSGQSKHEAETSAAKEALKVKFK